jgi:hypothetical protein
MSSIGGAVMSAIGSAIGSHASLLGNIGASRIKDREAEWQEQQAASALAAAAIEEAKLRRTGQRVMGSQVVAYSKAGVDSTGGSAAWVSRDTAMEIERDALMARYEGDLRATEYRNQATMTRFSAKLMRKGAWMNWIGDQFKIAGSMGSMGGSSGFGNNTSGGHNIGMPGNAGY